MREAQEGLEEDEGLDVGDEPAAPEETAGDDSALAPSESAEVPGQGSVTRAQGAAGPVLRILPLGSGLVLIGLGLALGLLALRLRRDARYFRPRPGGH
ncbi:hypothetical protein ACFW6K_13550 [Streptomyces sp. NPDC058733]|uniref:hypothetical protein n=1 Tax=unclassified Streptomyces TaxID=2593676 RepID=UPI0034517410